MGNGGANVASKKKALATVDQIVDEFKENGSPSGLLELIGEADRGDAEALSRLRVVYAAIPEIANHLSGLQYNAEHEALAHYAPGGREATLAECRKMRKELAGDNPSPLERLLAGRIVLDWLHALEADRQYQLKPGESRSITLSDFYAKQQERAHRRLMRSTKTLAEVRKLLRPAVQVNIADKQVNVAGDVHTGVKEAAA
jgi:hypothetical protein